MELRVVLFFLALLMKVVSATDWCYESQVSCNSTCAGPDAWQKVAEQCGGGHQSPVNIMTRKTVQDERLTPIQFGGYQEKFHSQLMNNGHTVQLDLPAGMVIRGGNLEENYKALQLHLHWGNNGAPGSEHTIDGEQFPMEMHIVHIKEEYHSLSQAVKDRRGIAVLGFLFQESKSANKGYAPLIDALQQIINSSSNTTLTGVSLERLIPPRDNLSKYFRYSGSLTTPDCSEAVVWTLFESTIPLSKDQLSAFCQLQFSDGTKMTQTYRPVQPLNERRVHYSKGNVSELSWLLLIMSMLLSSAIQLHSDR